MSDAPPPSYPEHEQLALVQSRSQAVGDFIEWLGQNQMAICTWIDRRDEWVAVGMGRDKLLALHFGIDLDRLEAEKRDIIARMSQPKPHPD